MSGLIRPVPVAPPAAPAPQRTLADAVKSDLLKKKAAPHTVMPQGTSTTIGVRG